MEKWQAISFANVRIDDSFWSPRIRANRERTLPVEYEQCKDTGRIDAFALDWQPGRQPKPHYFWDSDVAKWVEAASYSLSQYPDPALERLLEEVIALIVSAQQPDGYLNVYFTVVEPEKRWKKLGVNHELYCAGHLIEAAVAHYEATGKRQLLDAMCRYADYIGAVFGRGEGQLRGYCGHEEIELALVKLYRATGKADYLRLAQYFVDERGQQPNYFVLNEQREQSREEMALYGEDFAYCQAHKPVREQSEVVGHAVRAMYLYCAMADLAGELGDASLLAACERIWRHLCDKNMYVTGGIGSSRHNEGFTRDYDLPNDTAYAETCAAIGFVMWNHRLLQLDCDSRYADMMERALYNGVISGVSLDGTRFFYENPLASLGSHRRSAWFDCACCPPNVARLLASLGQYVYSVNGAGDSIAAHLYVQGRAQIEAAGQTIILEQTHEYPWDGRISLTVTPERTAGFELRLRIPAWCKQATLRINGVEAVIGDESANRSAALDVQLRKGYAVMRRVWQPGDVVELDLNMPVQRVYSHPRVRPNVGLVALQRGPVVYCLEQADNGANLETLSLPADAPLKVAFAPELLGGIAVIRGEAKRIGSGEWAGDLYDQTRPQTEPALITAIPYSHWDNRDGGEMLVWLREA